MKNQPFDSDEDNTDSEEYTEDEREAKELDNPEYHCCSSFWWTFKLGETENPNDKR